MTTRRSVMLVIGVVGLVSTFPGFGLLNVSAPVAGLIGGFWFCICLIAGEA